MLNHYKNPYSRIRRGVTLIEVLTSIVVAVIGVAGVLVLIPFGIRQSQVGLDLDSATKMAENALARFEIEGFGRSAFWGGDKCMPWIDANVATPMNLIDRNSNATSCYWIDPLSQRNFDPAEINNLYMPVGGADINVFQMGDGFSQGASYQPQFAQLLNLESPFTPMPNPINLAIANRIFQTHDDLQFAFEKDPESGNEIDDRSPPRQYLDQGPSGSLRRQSRGEISWSAVAVPRRNLGQVDLNAVEGFDFYVLVYRDRDFRVQYPVAEVQAGAAPQTIQGSGTISLNASVDIENDQWIMLVSYDGLSQPNVGFFRVIGSDPANSRVSVDGLAYTIPAAPQKTFAIAITNVVNIYKRQLEIEESTAFSFR